MRTAAAASVRRPDSQTSSAGSTSDRVPGTPHVNALPHGLRSGHVLLPGDNVAEFRKLRHRLFHLHRPRTIAEAGHVETLAVNAWRVARCRVEQRFFKGHLGAAMSGHPDATGYLCDPDLHKLHHRGTDCQKDERRLERSTAEAEAALARLQTERTGNLTPGVTAVLEPYEVFLAEGEPVVEEEPPPQRAAGTDAPGAGGVGEPAALSATGSAERGNSKGPKRDAPVPGSDVPKHWNRRQRRVVLRKLSRRTTDPAG